MVGGTWRLVGSLLTAWQLLSIWNHLSGYQILDKWLEEHGGRQGEFQIFINIRRKCRDTGASPQKEGKHQRRQIVCSMYWNKVCPNQDFIILLFIF